MNEVTQPGRGRRVLGLATAMIVALAAFLVFAPLASAASDPLAGGTTTIEVGKGFGNKLSKSGVKLLGVKPATVKKGSDIGLPVSSGAIDPLTGQGTVVHAGGFKFKRGKKTAPVSELVLEAGAKSLLAKVAGKKMKFASADGVSVTRDGFGTNLVIGKLKLTSKAAKALNLKLGFPSKNPKGKAKGKASASKGPQAAPFKGNQTIGGAVSDTEPATVSVVATGVAQLLATKADLESSFKVAEVRPLMIAPATIGAGEPPPLFFPIVSGTVATSGLTGTIQTAGAVAFGQEPEGGLQIAVAFDSIEVDLTTKTAMAQLHVESNDQEKAPTPGALGKQVMGDLDFSAGVVRTNPVARTVTIENVATRIRADLASLMNTTYKKEAFEAGDSLGAFTITVQTQ